MHPATRRHHQKSRTGCMTCKHKKIKCDEVKPSCLFCTRRSLQCTYPVSKSPPPPPPPPTAASNLQTSHVTPNSDTTFTTSTASTPSTISAISVLTFATPPAIIPLGPSADCHLVPSGNWSLCDLELLHFYTVATSQSFSHIPARRNVWQFVVPQIAFSHDFLLHEILALSATHLSLTSPERKESLLAIASSHHAIALPIFRSAVQDVSSQNHHACSVFGTLLTLYEWAATKQSGNFFFEMTQQAGEASSSTFEWVQLLRGSGKIVQTYFEEIQRGPLAPIMHWDQVAESEAEMNPTEPLRFTALEELWETDKLTVTAEETVALREALRWLRIIYTTMTTPNSNNDSASAALSWPVRVPDLYLEMVKQHHPAAMILLSHFCLLLNKVDDFWWIRGMSRRLLQAIHQTIGSTWEVWIAWPLQDLVLCEFQQQGNFSLSI